MTERFIRQTSIHPDGKGRASIRVAAGSLSIPVGHVRGKELTLFSDRLKDLEVSAEEVVEDLKTLSFIRPTTQKVSPKLPSPR